MIVLDSQKVKMAEPKVPLSSSARASANGSTEIFVLFFLLFISFLPIFPSPQQAAEAAVFNAVLYFPVTWMD